MSDTTILTNARVHTMDAQNPHADALAVRDGRLLAVGRHTDVVAAAPDATVVDAGGALVVPGFVDAHHHVSLSALYHTQVDISPAVVRDIPQLQQVLADAAAAVPEGQWIVATKWDEHLMVERRAPSLAELDEALPNHPLFGLHYTCHRAVANTRALALAQIDAATPDPSGGLIERTGKRPNGLLIERGMSRVEALARASLVERDRSGLMDRIAAHYDMMIALGITAVADTTVPMDIVDVYRACARRGDVRIPTVICPVSSTGYLEEPWEVIESDLAPSGTADEGNLIVGPVKLVFDGAPACSMCLSWWSSTGVMLRTAAMALRRGSLDPLRATMSAAPRFGADVRTGIAIYQPDEAQRVVSALTERGFAVATHAVGNAAVDVALRAYEHVGARVHDAGRARLEHASFLDDELVARIAGVGAIVVPQANFMTLPAYGDTPDIPGLSYMPLRQLLDAGVLLGGSSDYPVAGCDPLDGVRCAVRRLSSRGEVRAPDQRLSVDEALRIHTRDAAEACGLLDRTGSLEVGKRADFVVLRGELDDLDSLCVDQTWVAGSCRFSSDVM